MNCDSTACIQCGTDCTPEEMRENGYYLCQTCAEEAAARELLAVAQDGDLVALQIGIDEAGFYFDDVIPQLCDEARLAAKRGDRDEAILLLRQAAEPKFKSIDQCKERYAEAMAEKRAREAA